MKSLFISILTVATLIPACSAKLPKTGVREAQASYVIKQLNAGKHVYLDSCIVWGDLDFTSLNNRNRIATNLTQVFVNQSVTFTNCVFVDRVKAFDAQKGVNVEFAHNITFTGCDFRGEVDFTESMVCGHVFFNGSVFRSTVKMQGAHFRHKKTYFSETKFEDEALFQNAIFAGDVNFLHAVFSKSAMFQKTVAGGLMFFGNARFKEYADFTYTRAAEAIFRYAEFNGRYDFSYSSLNAEGLDVN